MREGAGVRKLLIIDPWQGYKDSLHQLIASDFEIEYCDDYSDVVRCIVKKKPDYMILNLACSEFDGFTSLRTVNSMGIHPSVVGIIQSSNFYLELCMRELNIAFHLTRPFSAKVLASRLTLLAELPKDRVVHLPTRRETVLNILLSLGINQNSAGGESLIELIPMAADNPAYSFTKHLYPAVGKLHGHSGLQVERNVRSAIENGWNLREKYAWNHYFDSDIHGNVEKPTNSEFITRLAKILESLRAQYCDG